MASAPERPDGAEWMLLATRCRHVAGPVVGIVVFAIGVIVLHRLAAEISWSEVKADMAGLPTRALVLAVCLTAVSYLAFSLYDVFSLQAAAPGRVPAPVAMMAGAAGYAAANLLGFSYITGPAVRSRIYSAYRIDLAIIATVIASIWVFFWIGIALLIGTMLLVHPTGIPALQSFSPALQKLLALAVLVAIGAFLVWLGSGARVLRLRSFSLPLPGLKVALPQIGVSIVDILASASVLYVLSPSDVAPNFAFFLVVYVGAVGLGILSHAPGGLGVFEATFIAGLGAGGRPDVLAALVLYRVIYYLLPFAIAALTLAVVWTATNRSRIGAAGRQVHMVVGALVPAMSAGLVLVTGVTLLLSGNLPGETGRLDALEMVLPLPVIEISHLLASMIGVVLIVLANGLYRKLHRAWLLAIGLTGTGAVLSLLKGFDWEEALLLGFALSLLFLYRSAFYRSAGQPIFIMSARWAVVSVGVVALSVWVGLFAYSHVEYSNDLWWRFAWNGDAPRYLRASLAAGVVLAALGINAMLTSAGRKSPPEPVPDAVRAIVAASTNAEANIHLTGDKRFLVAPDGDAFIGYADTGHSLIAKGDPIGEHASSEALIWEFREMADRLGKKCAFYAVWEEFLPAYLDMGCSILKIGEIARVDLQGFSLEGPGKKDFRYAQSKAARESYVFEIVPKQSLEGILEQLRAISDAWLHIKHGKEKAFALGRFDRNYLRNFDHAIVRHAPTGRIFAFATIFQSAQRHELSLDLMRYDPTGPSFVMDALFAELLLWGKAQGFRWFSLGAAPFAGMASHSYATTWSRIGSYIYEHGENVYHFEGLRAFKQKFDPVWSPNYLALPHGLAAPRILFEVNGLISGGIKGLLT